MPKTTEDLIELIDHQHTAIEAMHKATDDRLGQLSGRTTEIEQHLAQRRGGVTGAADTLGAQVAKSDGLKQFIGAGCKGTIRIPISAALTTLPASAGALIAPDRQADVVGLPRMR